MGPRRFRIFKILYFWVPYILRQHNICGPEFVYHEKSTHMHHTDLCTLVSLSLILLLAQKATSHLNHCRGWVEINDSKQKLCN